MQSKLLSKKVLSSILALGALTVSSTTLANSGGYEDGSHYVGLYPNGSNVVIDEAITGVAYGSRIFEGTASNNTVTVSADCEGAAGASVKTGDAVSNKVIVHSGKTGIVYGATIQAGNAKGNSVTVNDGEVIYAIGAFLEAGNAKGNSVIVNGGEVYNAVGAYATEGDVLNNYIEINGGDVRSAVGASVENGNAEGNGVIINTDTEISRVVGAIVGEGNAFNNFVIVNGGNIIASPVYGAKVENGNAEGNMVVIDNSSTSDGVYGAIITGNGNAKGNTVVINGGSISAGVVYGAAIDSDTEGKVSGNGVILNGGSVKGGSVYGAMTANGTAEGNYVVIDTVQPNSYFDVYGGYTAKGDALNNSVVINGGKITGTVYGGYTDNGKAKGNVITISGDTDLTDATLIAGFENANSNKLLLSNNTDGENIIRINGWSGSIAGISGTDVIEINGSKLTDNGIINITSGEQDDLNGTIIKVNSIAGGQNVAAGDTLKIITSENTANLGIDVGDIKTSEEGIMGGVASSITGEFKVDEKTGEIVFEVNNVQAAKQTAITTETRAAAAAMVNQGSEVIVDSISKLQYEDAGVSTFATISGNNSKYKTGSYVDINGWNGIVGAAKTVEAGSGKLSYGAFFENGSGNYNTYNDFNGNVLRGDGNAVYNGGGLLMRYAKENGVYTEASVRAGLAKNEVSNALVETSGKTHGFKTENTYYGAHVGIGKLIKLEKGKSWDIYGKYFYTHHEGDSVTIANDSFDFDAIDSSKLRLGVRFSEQQGDKLTSYYGLAWEYEFSGDVGGTAAGHRMYTPSLDGSTVIGEVGFRYTPGEASPWYFDANVKGYAGMQQGISGSVQAVYSF